MSTPRITLAMLRGACKDQRAIFKAEWPQGADVTIENVQRAIELGLALSWGLRWFTPEAVAEYERQRALLPEYQRQSAQLWAEYDRQRELLWAEYERQRAPLWAEYQRQRAPLRAEYERQVAPLRAEYQRQSALLWAEYYRQVAPLWVEAFLKSRGETE